MKQITFILSLFLLVNSTYSQQTANTAARVDSIAEGLVAIALKGAQVKSTENRAEASLYQHKATKTLWLNNITAMGNLNEFSIKQSTGAVNDPLRQNALYPRYNIVVVVPLGMFVNNAKQSKATYYQYQALNDQVKVEQQNVRRDVITAYQDYLMNLQLKDLQQGIVNDYKVIYMKTEERFRNGQTTLEQYNNASTIYNDALSREITINRDIAVIRATLESLIGMNLDDAFAQIRAGNVK